LLYLPLSPPDNYSFKPKSYLWKKKRYPGFMAKLIMGGLILFAAGCSQQDVVEPAGGITSGSLAKKSKEKTFY
jgi:hypothetical protein